MPPDSSTPCEYARSRHRRLVLWRDLWTVLLFVFGAATVGFLVLAVFYLLQQAWLPAALTTLGTLAEGAAIRWVAERRADAAREEEHGYRDVEEQCP